MSCLGLIVAAVLLGDVALTHRASWRRSRTVLAWAGVAALLALAAALSPGRYELRKFVALCLMPAGLAWLGLLAFACGLWRRRLRGPAVAAAALWLLATAAGNAWVGSALIDGLQRPYARIDPLAQGRFDAVAVLGGGVEVRNDGRPDLTAAGERAVLGVLLWRAGRTPRLVASGPYEPIAGGGVTSNAAATAVLWEQLGVPPASIVLLQGPRTTTDEVAALAQLVAERGWRRVGLVTSAWHMRRAIRLCARRGLEVTPLPAEALRVPGPQLRWLVPQEVGFWRVQHACWEVLGSLAGR